MAVQGNFFLHEKFAKQIKKLNFPHFTLNKSRQKCCLSCKLIKIKEIIKPAVMDCLCIFILKYREKPGNGVGRDFAL